MLALLAQQPPIVHSEESRHSRDLKRCIVSRYFDTVHTLIEQVAKTSSLSVLC